MPRQPGKQKLANGTRRHRRSHCDKSANTDIRVTVTVNCTGPHVGCNKIVEIHMLCLRRTTIPVRENQRTFYQVRGVVECPVGSEITNQSAVFPSPDAALTASVNRDVIQLHVYFVCFPGPALRALIRTAKVLPAVRRARISLNVRGIRSRQVIIPPFPVHERRDISGVFHGRVSPHFHGRLS